MIGKAIQKFDYNLIEMISKDQDQDFIIPLKRFEWAQL
jgi:hypothetical protein